MVMLLFHYGDAAIVGAGSFPYKLDVFAGRIYWTTSDRNQIKTVDKLGQGNVTTFLSGQLNVGATRYVQILKYNEFSKPLRSLLFQFFVCVWI